MRLPRQIDAVLDVSAIRLPRAFCDVARRPAAGWLCVCHPARTPALCTRLHLNLAYKWFRRLSLEGDVPDHSASSKNRQGCFRDSNLFRKLFEQIPDRETEQHTPASTMFLMCNSGDNMERNYDRNPQRHLLCGAENYFCVDRRRL